MKSEKPAATVGIVSLSPGEKDFWEAIGGTFAWIRYVWKGPEPKVEVETFNVYPKQHFSAQSIYRGIIDAIEALEIPGVMYGPQVMHEGGRFSYHRAYLSIEREFSQFLVCAAQVGVSYMITVRKVDRFPHVKWWHYLFLLLFLATVILYAYVELGAVGSLVFIAGLVALGWSCARHASSTVGTWLSKHLHEIPVVGPLYLRWFRPDTFFRQDLHRAFLTLVTDAIKTTISGLEQAQAIRPPTEKQGAPILRDLHPDSA